MLPKFGFETVRKARGTAAILARWLTLAAAPTFAIMALMTAWQSDGREIMIHAARRGGQLFGGMAPMYILMSAFHFAPWLGQISNRSMPHVPSDVQ